MSALYGYNNGLFINTQVLQDDISSDILNSADHGIGQRIELT